MASDHGNGMLLETDPSQAALFNDTDASGREKVDWERNQRGFAIRAFEHRNPFFAVRLAGASVEKQGTTKQEPMSM